MTILADAQALILDPTIQGAILAVLTVAVAERLVRMFFRAR